MSYDLVPPVDPTPLPGPAWLFHVLLVLTFFLHVVFMDLALGGTLIAAVSQLRSGGREGDFRTVLAQRIMGVNAYAISLAITAGIAPLLFVQVLYQQYFYPATILIGWAWLLFLVLLMAGYYAAYAYKFRGAPAHGRGGTGWLVVAAVLFLLVATVHVAVHLIHAQPGAWATFADHPWTVLADPTYFPRLLHFLFAAMALSGLVFAWWSTRQARAGEHEALNREIAAYAWKWALAATVLQVVDGLLLLLLLPQGVFQGVIRGGPAPLVSLTVSVLLGIGLLVMMARVSDPVARPKVVTGTLAAVLGAVAVMSIFRHQLRALYLADARSRYELVAAPQWGNFVLFALVLVAGLIALAYMVRRVLRGGAQGAEAA